jgi:hypothetical protein
MQKIGYLLAGLSLAVAMPAVAGGVKNVPIQDALDNKVSIPVAIEGGGVNIDFSPTGETIYKITIDDPSLVSVDHCLVVGNCNGQDWSTIRLWITGIVFLDIPRSKTTKLSVFTRDKASKESSIYEFQVSTSQKPTAFTKYVIGGVSRNRDRAFGVQSSSSFQNGIRAAQRNRLIVDPAMMARLVKYNGFIAQGDAPQKAARKAGISLNVANKISEMGSVPSVTTDALPRSEPSAVVSPSKLNVPSPPPAASQPKAVLPPTPSIVFSRSEVVVSSAPPSSAPTSLSTPAPAKTAAKAQPAIASVSPQGKPLSNLTMANKLSVGLAVATSKHDYAVTARRYWINTAIRRLRHQKASSDVSKSIPTIARKNGLPISVLRKTLKYGGYLAP